MRDVDVEREAEVEEVAGAEGAVVFVVVSFVIVDDVGGDHLDATVLIVAAVVDDARHQPFADQPRHPERPNVAAAAAAVSVDVSRT